MRYTRQRLLVIFMLIIALVISGVPKYPKLGMDSYNGWFAYLAQDNLLFVKRYPTYPKRVYNEIAGLTISIYYTKEKCELEPIGPKEYIAPGESVSFTEDWWLLPHKFPKALNSENLKRVKNLIDKKCQAKK